MDGNILIKFGQTVRELRLKKLISQEDLAAMCELHRTYISDIELGKRNISLENIDKISRALKIKLSDLFEEVEKR